jgi:hypothetical protein
MRRADRRITEPAEIEAILERAAVMRLAMCDGSEPYLVPLSCGYRDGRLYFHSAPEGRKLDLLHRNPQVCFEVSEIGAVRRSGRPCHWGQRYASVIGRGRAVLVEDAAEKRRALERICRNYGADPAQIGEAGVAGVAVVRIEIAALSGKRSP